MTARACAALQKLHRHGLSNFAITGSVAMQLQLGATRRRLNDLDIVVNSLDAIPPSTANDYLIAHIHPNAATGKTLLQLVDPALALRIDFFRACGATLERSRLVCLTFGTVQAVSLEDLAARAARILMTLEANAAVPRKHARDFLRLTTAIDAGLSEQAWREHRQEWMPTTFQEAAHRIPELLASRPHLLTTPQYSQDLDAVCPRCQDTAAFERAAPRAIHSILGYC